jgi:hypothetical protein
MQTLSFIEENKFNGFDDIKELVGAFYKKKITVSYEPITSESTKRRVIFTCSKKVRNYTFDAIALECNGLILEASKSKWKLLAVPMLSPKTDVNTRKINDWLGENLFEVYAMEDGTAINLYYYNDRWTISTARGFDMNNVKFNEMTYQALLEECITKYVKLEDFYQALDQNFCYTFGFKHPDMHPFREGNTDIYKIWSIQQVDLRTSCEAENALQPRREKVLPALPTQKKFNFKTRNMHNLYKRLKTAYDDFMDGRLPNYGYILVSNNPGITGEYSVLMLESSLMKVIRNLWYNGSYVECSRIRNCNRINLILLNSYLDETRHDLFLDLFPQYSNKFDDIKQHEESIVKDIYSLIKGTADTLSPNGSILQPLANEVKNILTIDIHDKPMQKIRDIIHSNKNIYVYYDICFPTAE